MGETEQKKKNKKNITAPRLASANFTMRHGVIKKYKGFQLLIDNVDEKELKEADLFNPNVTYLYGLDVDFTENFAPSNPLYFLQLIPSTDEFDLTIKNTIYLLQFVNFAVYFYKKLSTEYDARQRYKSNGETVSDYETAKSMAIIIENMTGVEHSLDGLHAAAGASKSKKTFKLKPSEFLILCQLFARGWYDQHFFKDIYKNGNVGFAHYLSNYIEQSYPKTLAYSMETYNADSSNIDSNLKNLFIGTKKLDFKLYGFHLIATQAYDYPGNLDIFSDIKYFLLPNKDYKLYRYKTKAMLNIRYSYAISVSQYGCQHSFYYYSQLHNERYKKSLYS